MTLQGDMQSVTALMKIPNTLHQYTFRDEQNPSIWTAASNVRFTTMKERQKERNKEVNSWEFVVVYVHLFSTWGAIEPSEDGTQ